MIQLNEILDSDNIVLIDNSANKTEGFSLCEGLYDCGIYSQIPKELLDEGIKEIDFMEDLLTTSNTRTIPELTEEIKKLEEILNEKIRYLDDRKSSPGRRGENKRHNQTEKEDLLKRLQKKVYEVRGLSKNKELRIQDRKYSLLTEMVKLIEKTAKLKRDTSYVYGFHEIDQSDNSDTDEKLTATLYYLSLFPNEIQDKKPVLLSGDRDFVSLLGVISRLIGSDDFLPDNARFRQSLINNPIRLYLNHFGEYNLALESSSCQYDERFRLGNIDPEESSLVKREISGLWKKFSEN